MTPALTTRGMKEKEMLQIGEWIDRVISKPADESTLKTVRAEIGKFCEKFSIYQNLLIS
ncbi:MAG: hypothetical protein V1798_10620 [Pseudomonadota bacterium]